MPSVSTSSMCSATAEIITRIKDAAFEIGPSHVQNAWSVKLPSVKTVGLQEQRKNTHLRTSRRMLQPNYSLQPRLPVLVSQTGFLGNFGCLLGERGGL